MENEKNIKFTEKPKLKHPYMVCGFNGWVDGGESSTGTIEYFKKKLRAKKFAEMPIEKFRVFQVPGEEFLRPDIKIENGVLKEHHLPSSEFFYSRIAGKSDVILFSGVEPNLNWEEYAQTLLSVISDFSIRRVYLLGGVLGKIPFTKEPNVSCVCSPPDLLKEMGKYNMQLTSYEGPGSFGTTLIHECQKKNIQIVSLMAVALYYPEYDISITHNAVSIRAILKRLNRLLDLNLDISDLDIEVADLKSKLEFIANQNSEFKDYVANLEKEYFELKYEDPLEISAAEAVRIAEELLKKKEP